MLLKRTFSLSVVAAALSGCAQLPDTANKSAQLPKLYSWVTLGPDGKQIARTVTQRTNCPMIQIDGKAFTMSRRDNGTKPTGFEQVISCETEIPKGAQSVAVENDKLKLLKAKAQRIVVIGDTGCRVKTGDYQNCNNVAGGGKPWPFAKTAKVVAKQNPDVIVHLGDYFYRESECPPGNKGCEGPTGFKWATWKADFFDPAAAMLATAPWVMTRGNHEDCKRAYKGWFYFFDAYPLKANQWQDCTENSPPYKVDLGDLSLINMDSSTLPDAFSLPVKPQTVDIYRKLFDQVNSQAEGSIQSWVMTHRPIWAISSFYDWQNDKDSIDNTDPTMQAAIVKTKAGGFDKSVNLALAGHIHNFETLSFNDGRPSVMVVGNSGTKLSPPITKAQLQNSDIFKTLKMAAEDFYADSRFGFILMERQPYKTWLIHLKDLEGNNLQSYILRDKRLERIWE